MSQDNQELITNFFGFRKGNKIKFNLEVLKLKKSQLNSANRTNSYPNLDITGCGAIVNYENNLDCTLISNSDFDESISILSSTVVDNIESVRGVSGEGDKKIENLCSNINSNMDTLNVSQALKFIPSFDGTPSNLHQFIECSNIIHDSLKDTEYPKFLNLMIKLLVGKAYNETVKNKKYETWDALKKDLQSKYKEIRSKIQVSEQLNNCRQKYNEDVRSFGNRIEDLLCQLNDICITEIGTGSEKTVETLNGNTALVAFQEGLNDKIRTIVKSAHCKSLKEAITSACEEEALLKRRFNFENKNSPKCKICNKIGHVSEKCFKAKNRNNSNVSNGSLQQSNDIKSHETKINKPQITCAYCKKLGHHIENCYSRKNKEEKKSQSNNNSKASTSREMNLVNTNSLSGNEKRLDQFSANWAVRAKDL